MRSTTKSHFSQVPRAEIQRSQFDCSHGYKTTFNAGLLIPIFVDEALPGDTYNLNLTAFARLATPLKPIMDNMFLETFFFAVPNRLVWDNWQRFNGEQDNPDDSTDYLVPEIGTSTGFDNLSTYDYFGVPVGIPDIAINALHNRAYNLIWNEWFRDQNLQDQIIVDKDDGPDQPEDYQDIQRRGKRHDYFTSCLPWPQKGEDVTIPMGLSAPVIPTNEAVPPTYTGQLDDFTGSIKANANEDSLQWGASHIQINPLLWGETNLSADLTEATATTINQLRESFQIQKLYERDARGGTRYTEIVKSHFGVTSPDSRLQRPEYLGGGSTPVNITMVPQTSATSIDAQPDEDTPQGNLAGYGTASASGHGFSKSFTEHCVIIGMVCVRADLTYQQGLNRMFSRQTRFDFYWPALSHLGEQEVLNKELVISGFPISDDAVFGYQERYAEYRYKPSQVTGAFRSSYPTSLDMWHLAQDFESQPHLNNEFIEEHPPIDRIIAVPSEPHFLFDSYFKLIKARPMPTYAIPGMIDHF